MDIESIVERLTNSGAYSYHEKVSLWNHDYVILHSFLTQINNKIGLTGKQINLVISIIKKYQKHIRHDFPNDFDSILQQPKLRFPIRNTVKEKTIKIVKSLDHTPPVIEVSFPYDINVINQIKENRNRCHLLKIPNDTKWVLEKLAWTLELTENNISFLEKNFITSGFKADEEFTRLSKQIKQILENLGEVVPMLSILNDTFYLKNASPFIPNLQTTDVLEALFFCKKYGIICWEDEINNMFADFDPCTSKILTTPNGTVVDLRSQQYSLESLTDLIKYSKRILFVIPGGNEHRCMDEVYKLLNKLNVSNSQMSVLFRTNKGAGVNSFIKENSLNNLVSENTKAVFISKKLPNPLIKEKVQFDAIVSFGIRPVHYQLGRYILCHHNSIRFNIP
jgi:hypothetical protein